jgi:hypothetical protein
VSLRLERRAPRGIERDDLQRVARCQDI